MEKIDFNELIERTRNLSIRSAYDGIRSFYNHNGISRDESKIIFIEFLKYVSENRIGVIKFEKFIENNENLNKLPLNEKLIYIYESFPTDYDESIPEKDIDNLWWYVGCPVTLGWIQPDGSYWFS